MLDVPAVLGDQSIGEVCEACAELRSKLGADEVLDGLLARGFAVDVYLKLRKADV